MTGFAAIFSDSVVSARELETMLSAMDYRARDTVGRWVKGPVAMGAAVLHTTSESFECDQPHTSEDEAIAVAMDGYLANYDDLRRDFIGRGIALRNRSDLELVLRAYELWGEDCAKRLEGEFALVIADMRNHRVFAARDPAGTRPLYYAVQGNSILVSTDAGPIAAVMDPAPEPNREFLAEVMAIRMFSGGATPWQNVYRLRQTHSLTFQPGAGGEPKLATRKYWSVPDKVTIRYKRDEEYVEHYLEVLTRCVKQASRSHLPLAMTVSGGLDSSALFCLAHRMIERGDILAPEIRAYTLGAEPDSPAYEVPYARAATDSVGRPLEVVPMFQPDLEWYRKEAAERRELPVSTNTAMSYALRQRVVEQGSRAIMGGHGGDEWLQGTAIYFRQMAEDLDFRRFFETLKTAASEQGWRKVAPFALRQAVLAAVPDPILAPLRRRKRLAERRQQQDLFWLTDMAKTRVADAEEAYLLSLPAEPMAFLKENLIAQPLGDFGKSFTAAQYARIGVEARTPMFARQFIEFSAHTPEHIKYRGAERKVVHRQAMKGILPDKVLYRRMKAHFPSEGVEEQFADFYQQYGEGLLDGWADEPGVARLLELYRQSPREIDAWSWEVWGVFAAAAFMLDNSAQSAY